MDYGGHADLVRHPGWADFCASPQRGGGRLVLFTTQGAERLDGFRFQPSDILLFGRESAGVPPEVHDAADARVLVPMQPGARSLNVAMTAGIALWEAARQTGRLPP
jgi:tRNA (cytidine/uridine-2'-O-)-methyltransferase